MQHKSFQNRIDVGIDFVASPNVSEIVKQTEKLQIFASLLGGLWGAKGDPKSAMVGRGEKEGRSGSADGPERGGTASDAE